MTDLNFRRIEYGKGHGYRLNGKRIPSVTTLLYHGLAKPNLIDWAGRSVAEFVADNADQWENWRRLGRGPLAKMLADIPNEIRNQAGVRGTEVHHLAQRLAAGDEVEVPDELQGHVDAYLAFYDDWQPTEEIAERPCLNRGRTNGGVAYGGTFDLLATVEPFGRVLIDFKTSKGGIYPDVALQLAAYRNAEFYLTEDNRLEPMPSIVETFGLWLRADGYDLHRVETGEYVYRSFLYCAAVSENFATVKREAFIGPSIQPRRGPRLAAV